MSQIKLRINVKVMIWNDIGNEDEDDDDKNRSRIF